MKFGDFTADFKRQHIHPSAAAALLYQGKTDVLSKVYAILVAEGLTACALRAFV